MSQLWRPLLLLLIVSAVVAGGYAFRSRFFMYLPGDISPDGARLIVYKYMFTSQQLDVWSYISDIETGKVLQDLSEFEPEWPRWRWTPDGESVIGFVKSSNQRQKRVLQIDTSPDRDRHTKVLHEFSLSSQRSIKKFSAQEDGSLIFVETIPGTLQVTESGKEVHSKPVLRFVTEANVELGRFEFGMDEYAFVGQYRDSERIVPVAFRAKQKANANGDYTVTDGTLNLTFLVHFD